MSSKKALILGGTGFMGRGLVSTLVDTSWDVTIFNRGKLHWEDHPHKGRIKQVTGDRRNYSAFIDFLQNSATPKSPWDIVVDFITFNSDDMLSIIEGFGFDHEDNQGRILKQYIFISTDSVYMSCVEPSLDNSGNPKTYVTEECAVRPKDKNKQNILKKKDEYGDSKLECEEILRDAFSLHQFPYTAIRLPDVFGPFDNTERHWMYQVWMTLGTVDLDKEQENSKLSFIFSEDVVKAIILVASSKIDTVVGQAFNFAQDETPTLKEYLLEVASVLNIPLEFNISDDKLPSYMRHLPSVDFGPISTEKAIKFFNWKPTPMKESVKVTCLWHEEAWFKYPAKRPLSQFNASDQQTLCTIYRLKYPVLGQQEVKAEKERNIKIESDNSLEIPLHKNKEKEADEHQ